MLKRHLQMVVGFCLASTLTACGGGGSSLPATSTTMAVGASARNAILAAPQPQISGSIPNAGLTYIAIDAGGSASGNWLADEDYSAVGITGTEKVFASINTSQITNPAPQSVYRTQRYGTDLTYTVPNLTPNAAYTVRLHFVESFFSAVNKRVFNVSLNGTSALTNFDIYKTAGGANIAVAKSFNVSASSTGKIAIALAASINNASIAGIEISSAAATPPPVLQIDSGGGPSGSWVADEFYTVAGWSGVAAVTSTINTSRVSDPAPQSIYQSQRWAYSLGYAIPNLKASAAYTVRLHFVESWWTAVGQRVFNVSINGAPVLSNFDIFKTAGGQNIAIVEQFATNADSAGKIAVQMQASVDNASVAGIEILSGASGSPTPTPSPTPSPTSSPTTAYPLYSSYFKGASPFHATVSYLKSLPGTKTLPTAVTQALFANGDYQSTVALGVPIYSTKSGDQAYTFSCTFYSSNGCNAQGKTVRIPSNAYTQDAIDHHIIDVDTAGAYEIDGWGGGSSSSQFDCSIGGYISGVVSCSWGGIFPFSGNGTDNNTGSSGIGAGYAVGAIYLSAQDMLNGLSGTPIKHALGISAGCLDNPDVYPSDIEKNTDTSCDNQNNGGVTQPAYGDLLVLNMTAAQIAATGYSPACKVVLNALASYGAYTTDTEGVGNGIAIDTEGAAPYGNTNNPWYSTIFPAFETNGNTDGSGSGINFTWNSCVQRLSASNFYMLQIQSGAGQ